MIRADVRYISSIHFWHSSSWKICYMLHESCFYVKLSQVASLFSKNIHYKFHLGLFWYGDVIIQKKVFLYELPFLVRKNLASLILSCIFWHLIELSYIFNQAVCPFLLFLFFLFYWYRDFKYQITVNSIPHRNKMLVTTDMLVFWASFLQSPPWQFFWPYPYESGDVFFQLIM